MSKDSNDNKIYVIKIILLPKGKTEDDLIKLLHDFLKNEKGYLNTKFDITKTEDYYQGFINIQGKKNADRILSKVKEKFKKIFQCAVRYQLKENPKYELQVKNGNGQTTSSNSNGTTNITDIEISEDNIEENEIEQYPVFIQTNRVTNDSSFSIEKVTSSPPRNVDPKQNNIKPYVLDKVKELILKKYQPMFEKTLDVKFKFEDKMLFFKGENSKCFLAFGNIEKFFSNRIQKTDKKQQKFYESKVVPKWNSLTIDAKTTQQKSFLQKLKVLEENNYYKFIGTSRFIDDLTELIKEENKKKTPNDDIKEEDDENEEEEEDNEEDDEENESKQINIPEQEEIDEEDENTITTTVLYGAISKFEACFKKIENEKFDGKVKFIKGNEKEKHLKVKITSSDYKKAEEKKNELLSILSIESIDVPDDYFDFYRKRLLGNKSNFKPMISYLPNSKRIFVEADKNNFKFNIISTDSSICKEAKDWINQKLNSLEYKRNLIIKNPTMIKFLSEQFKNENFLIKYDLKGINFKIKDQEEQTKFQIFGPKKVVDHFFSDTFQVIKNHLFENKVYPVKGSIIPFIINQLKNSKFDGVSITVDNSKDDNTLKISYLAIDQDDLDQVQSKIEKIINESKSEKVELGKVNMEKLKELTESLEQEYDVKIKIPKVLPGVEISKVVIYINGTNLSEIQSAKNDLLNESKKVSDSMKVIIHNKYILNEFKGSLMKDISKDIKLLRNNIILTGKPDTAKIVKEKIEKFIEYNLLNHSIDCGEYPLEILKLFSTSKIFRDEHYALEEKHQCSIQMVDNVLAYALIGKCIVKLVEGDITEAYCNVVVNPANVDLNHEGGLAKIILDKAGNSVNKECQEWLKSNKLTIGKCMMTNSGKLKCQKLIHTVGPIYQGNNNDANLLKSSIVETLILADKNMFQTIAIPAISTGIFGYPVNDALQIITNVVKDLTPNLKYLKSISFYSNIKEVASLWKRQMLLIMNSKNLSQGIIIEQPKNNCLWYFTDDEKAWKAYNNTINSQIQSNFEKKKLEFDIDISGSTYHFDLKNGTQTNIKTNFKRKLTNSLPNQPSYLWKWEDDSKQFTPYNVNQNNTIEAEYQKYINGNKIVSQNFNIVRHVDDQLGNYKFDFSQMIQINTKTNYIRKIKRDKIEKPVEFIIDDDDDILIPKCYIEFLGKDPKNAIKSFNDLDKKYQQKREINGVVNQSFLDKIIKDTNCKITVLNGKIICEGYYSQLDSAYPKIVDEILNTKTTQLTIKYPDTWKSNQDINLSILNPSSQEYKDIANMVFKTQSCSIIRIERIENKTLWKKYCTNKNDMKNPKETLLFHGTHNSDPIIIYTSENGFDFRHSKNGMWGRGAYFAVNASYSFSGYKFTNSQGENQVFCASVLIGDTTSLNPDGSLIHPPFKTGTNIEYDSVNGVTNGSQVYIIYRLNYAYPSYLITFK